VGVPPAPAGVSPGSDIIPTRIPRRRLAGRMPAGAGGTPTLRALMKPMNPTRENLSPSETRARGEAKGNCVVPGKASVRGGEHPEATVRSQTQVNSIRPLQRASWRRNRICRRQLRGVLAKPGPKARPTDGSSRVYAGPLALWGGWSENEQKGSWAKSGSPPRRGTVVDDRAPIVALKRVTTVERRGVGR